MWEREGLLPSPLDLPLGVDIHIDGGTVEGETYGTRAAGSGNHGSLATLGRPQPLGKVYG